MRITFFIFVYLILHASSLLASNEYCLIVSKKLNVYSVPHKDSIQYNLSASIGGKYQLLSEDKTWMKMHDGKREFYLYKPTSEYFTIRLIEDGSFLSNISNEWYFGFPFKTLLFYIIVLIAALAYFFVIVREDSPDILSFIFSGLLLSLLLFFFLLYKKQYINYWLFDAWRIYDFISWHTIKATFAMVWNSIILIFVLFSTLMSFMAMLGSVSEYNDFKKKHLSFVSIIPNVVFFMIGVAIILPILIFVSSIFTDVRLNTSNFGGFFSSLWAWVTIKEGWLSFTWGVLMCLYIFYSIYASALFLFTATRITIPSIVYFIISIAFFALIPIIIHDTLACLSHSNFILGLFALLVVFVLGQGAKSSSRYTSAKREAGGDRKVAEGVEGFYFEDELQKEDPYNDIYKVGGKTYKKTEGGNFKEWPDL